MKFFVYVLRSQKNGRLYTGSTHHVEQRLIEHNAGKSAATRNTRPFELLRLEVYPSRTEAVQRERFLKTGQGRKELKRLSGLQGEEA